MINYSIGKAYNAYAGSYFYRAYAQYTDVMDLDKFAEHLVSHGCVYSKADVSAICTMIVSCIRELLLEGYRIQFGDLGTFYVSLKSDGTSTYAEFTSSNITDVKVKLQLGDDFDDMIDDASFNHVMTKEEAAIAEALADADYTQATVAAAAGLDLDNLTSATATLDTSSTLSSNTDDVEDDDEENSTEGGDDDGTDDEDSGVV